MSNQTQTFRPGRWTSADTARNVALSVPALALFVVPSVVVSIRAFGLVGALLVALGTAAVVTPLVLLVLRRGVRRERVVVAPDAVELRRGDRVRRRVARSDRLEAWRFRSEARGLPVGPAQLLLTDGRSTIRLQNGRWLSVHEDIVDAVGLSAPTTDITPLMRRHPHAFAWYEHHPHAAAFAIIGALVVVILLAFAVAGVVVALF